MNRTSPGLCLLVEDQAPTVEFLRTALGAAVPDLQLVVATTFKEASHWLGARENDPARPPLRLAIVDLGLPDGSGVEIVRRLGASEPEARAVVVTIFDDDVHLFAALSAGASGYLLKDEHPDLMVEMLKRIRRDEPPLSPSIAHRLLAHFRAPGPAEAATETALTPRETETLTLLARGMTVPEAANRMGLSAQTVAGYVKVIYQKLHVSSRAEATREAIRRGLV